VYIEWHRESKHQYPPCPKATAAEWQLANKKIGCHVVIIVITALSSHDASASTAVTGAVALPYVCNLQLIGANALHASASSKAFTGVPLRQATQELTRGTARNEYMM
jgi:hypothetical protein